MVNALFEPVLQCVPRDTATRLVMLVSEYVLLLLPLLIEDDDDVMVSDAESIRGGDNGQLRLLDSRHFDTWSSSPRRVHPRLGRVRSSRHVCIHTPPCHQRPYVLPMLLFFLVLMSPLSFDNGWTDRNADCCVNIIDEKVRLLRLQIW